MVESALSPPYDGSEFQELFPDLTGVEPEEMVDIESLADRALDSVDVATVENQSVMLNDNVSIHSLETNSDMSDNGSFYECDVSEEEAEEDAEDPDQLLRYLIEPTSRKSNRHTQRQRQQSSNDSGRFSDSSHDQASASSILSQAQASLSVTRKYTKRSEPQLAKPATLFTVIDEKGARKSVRGPNRNAVMAKLNRERKKQIMVDLEEKVGLLDTENDALKKQNVCLRKKVDALARELQYVKGVLANQSTLSSLLKNIRATGLEFHTSMPLQQSGANISDIPRASQKRKRQSDHDYCVEQNEELPSSKVVKCDNVDSPKHAKVQGNLTNENVFNCASEGAGVCLHVSGNNVSLEFCSKCSGKAKLAGSRC